MHALTTVQHWMVPPSPAHSTHPSASVTNVRRISWPSVDIDRRAHSIRSVVPPLVHLRMRQILAKQKIQRRDVAVGVLGFGGGPHASRQVGENVPAKRHGLRVSTPTPRRAGRACGSAGPSWRGGSRGDEGGQGGDPASEPHPGEHELILSFGLAAANCIVHALTAAFERPYAMPSKSVSAE